jgi:hypothetical protein
MKEKKRRLLLIEEGVHAVLSPLGFRKQTTNWRRTLPQVLQQFAIASKQLGASYRPEWGLNLFSVSENPRPVVWGMHVRWVLEQALPPTGRQLSNPKVLRVLKALRLDSDMPDAERIRVVTDLIVEEVLPCFDMYQTRDAVRRMMGDWDSPRRAQMFLDLPEEWWPKD